MGNSASAELVQRLAEDIVENPLANEKEALDRAREIHKEFKPKVWQKACKKALRTTINREDVAWLLIYLKDNNSAGMLYDKRNPGPSQPSSDRGGDGP